jgi:hypothetical protein
VVSEDDEDKEDTEASGGHSEEVDRDQVANVVSEERPPGLRGAGAVLRHEAGHGALGDVNAELEAPHRGFAAAIFLTSAAISALMGGRPPLCRPESWVQYSRKRRRCQRRTVSGETMIST